MVKRNDEHRTWCGMGRGLGGGRGLIGPRHEIPRKPFRCSFGYCVLRVLRCKLVVDGGKKGEREKFERRDEGIMYY